MHFLAPTWFLLLLPWAALTVYFVNGRGSPAVVPFLPLWRVSGSVSRRPARRPPPLFILLMLLTLLLVILATARPVWRTNRSVAGDVSIVLDRGATMARPAKSGRIFRGVVDKANDALGPIAGRVSIITVPGTRVEAAGQTWVAAAKSIPPTAIPVDLSQALNGELRRTSGPVVLLSDQHLDIVNDRIIQIQPEDPDPAVAITLVAADENPRPQVLVRLENHSNLTSVRLAVTSGTAHLERRVELGPRGTAQDEFVNLSKLDHTVSVTIDSSPADDPWGCAWLARQSGGIHIAAIGNLPDAVEKFIAVYAKDRSASDSAPQVFVSSVPLNESQSGIWIDATFGTAVVGPVTVSSEAITQNVKTWPAQSPPIPLPAGFKPVVTWAAAPVVAIREQPARQVWIRGNLQEWIKTVDFVEFFANSLDWLAIQKHYSFNKPAMLGSEWKSLDTSEKRMLARPGSWPGLYSHNDSGRLVAINAGDYPSIGPSTGVKSQRFLSSLKSQERSLAAPIILLALLSLLVAISVFPSLRSHPKRRI